MKKVILTLALGVAMALPGMLSAQDHSATISKESQKGTGTSVTTKKEGTAEPLKAKGTGIVYMMSKDGFQVINPAAPASVGSGKQNVTPQLFAYGATPSETSNGYSLGYPYGGINIIGVSW